MQKISEAVALTLREMRNFARPGMSTNYRDKYNTQRFRKNDVVAIETYISTRSTYAEPLMMTERWQAIKEVIWRSMNIQL